MAYTFRSKRMAYDNIANGSATGIERHVAGGGGIETTRDGIDNIGVSADYVNSSNVANRVRELDCGHATLVSDANCIWFGARTGPGTGANAFDPTSATTPGYTSTTSFTSAIGELLG